MLKKLAREFITSVITVILAILAIILFISSGGSFLFYIAVVLALLCGAYNAWQISIKEKNEEAATKPKELKTKKRKR